MTLKPLPKAACDPKYFLKAARYSETVPKVACDSKKVTKAACGMCTIDKPTVPMKEKPEKES